MYQFGRLASSRLHEKAEEPSLVKFVHHFPVEKEEDKKTKRTDRSSSKKGITRVARLSAHSLQKNEKPEIKQESKERQRQKVQIDIENNANANNQNCGVCCQNYFKKETIQNQSNYVSAEIPQPFHKKYQETVISSSEIAVWTQKIQILEKQLFIVQKQKVQLQNEFTIKAQRLILQNTELKSANHKYQNQIMALQENMIKHKSQNNHLKNQITQAQSIMYELNNKLLNQQIQIKQLTLKTPKENKQITIPDQRQIKGEQKQIRADQISRTQSPLLRKTPDKTPTPTKQVPNEALSEKNALMREIESLKQKQTDYLKIIERERKKYEFLESQMIGNQHSSRSDKRNKIEELHQMNMSYLSQIQKLRNDTEQQNKEINKQININQDLKCQVITLKEKIQQYQIKIHEYQNKLQKTFIENTENQRLIVQYQNLVRHQKQFQSLYQKLFQENTVLANQYQKLQLKIKKQSSPIKPKLSEIQKFKTVSEKAIQVQTDMQTVQSYQSLRNDVLNIQKKSKILISQKDELILEISNLKDQLKLLSLNQKDLSMLNQTITAQLQEYKKKDKNRVQSHINTEIQTNAQSPLKKPTQKPSISIQVQSQLRNSQSIQVQTQIHESEESSKYLNVVAQLSRADKAYKGLLQDYNIVAMEYQQLAKQRGELQLQLKSLQQKYESVSKNGQIKMNSMAADYEQVIFDLKAALYDTEYKLKSQLKLEKQNMSKHEDKPLKVSPIKTKRQNPYVLRSIQKDHETIKDLEYLLIQKDQKLKEFIAQKDILLNTILQKQTVETQFLQEINYYKNENHRKSQQNMVLINLNEELKLTIQSLTNHIQLLKEEKHHLSLVISNLQSVQIELKSKINDKNIQIDANNRQIEALLTKVSSLSSNLLSKDTYLKQVEQKCSKIQIEMQMTSLSRSRTTKINELRQRLYIQLKRTLNISIDRSQQEMIQTLIEEISNLWRQYRVLQKMNAENEQLILKMESNHIKEKEEIKKDYDVVYAKYYKYKSIAQDQQKELDYAHKYR